jgi:hypothetical protein
VHGNPTLLSKSARFSSKAKYISKWEHLKCVRLNELNNNWKVRSIEHLLPKIKLYKCLKLVLYEQVLCFHSTQCFLQYESRTNIQNRMVDILILSLTTFLCYISPKNFVPPYLIFGPIADLQLDMIQNCVTKGIHRAIN